MMEFYYNETMSLIEDNKENLIKISDYLLENESITNSELNKLLDLA